MISEPLANRRIRARWHADGVPWYADFDEFDGSTARGMRLIGRRVRHRRIAAHLTQRQLESISGVHQSTISRLENGRLFGMRWTRFARLVDVLGGLDSTDPLPPVARRFLPLGGRDERLSEHR